MFLPYSQIDLTTIDSGKIPANSEEKERELKMGNVAEHQLNTAGIILSYTSFTQIQEFELQWSYVPARSQCRGCSRSNNFSRAQSSNKLKKRTIQVNKYESTNSSACAGEL